MKVAIIPARGGSKRIKKKNIKIFYRKPMIYWTIKKIKESKIFDKIIVTSDDKKILNYVKKKVDITINRPKELSDDFTPTQPVIKHAISFLNKIGIKIKIACCIYPCNPFLEASDLKKSLNLLKKNKYSKFILPITKYSHPIQRAFSVSKNNKLNLREKDKELKRTQDLKEFYFDAGQFYFGTANNWLRNKKIHDNAVGHIIPSWRSVDIDNIEDWKRAELLFNKLV
jgi:pseudaminic acid cytidylyltransferase